MASLRSNYYLAEARARAVSPLRYGTELPALHALAGSAAGEVRIIIRADPAASGPDRLCALAAALGGDSRVTWAARSSEVEPCIRGANRRPVSLGPAPGGELARARWVVLGPGGRVLHSGWEIPDPATVRETAALFVSTPLGGGRP